MPLQATLRPGQFPFSPRELTYAGISISSGKQPEVCEVSIAPRVEQLNKKKSDEGRGPGTSDVYLPPSGKLAAGYEK